MKIKSLTKEDVGKRIIYWSNSCGNTHYNGERSVDPDDLPSELKRVYKDLYYESRFGLSHYLAQFDGVYGLSLEADYQSDYAEDYGVSYDRMKEIMQKQAERIAERFPQFQVYCGLDYLAWSDGTYDSGIIVFLPWDTSFEDYQKIGRFFGMNAYVYDDETLESWWKELTDVMFDEDENGKLLLSADWRCFSKGTWNEDIWHWFDEQHSKGVGWLYENCGRISASA